ncbi:hypothetical protein HFN78_14215 [Rhizobium laguerreae]|uniref:hypothetical protein n=1 Tax=Rhizobium laguerreae TaxID=1076926 RepID=UPI001C90CC8E|nr:hypothetical protein [Rhizobium laguerreae]MBY3472073.1 hypothetical protein [Rhizobium laguerreae]
MTALQFIPPHDAATTDDFVSSNVLPFPISRHVGFVDREARKIVAGRTTISGVLERRAAYMYRTQSPPEAAYGDLVRLEDALIARCAELRAGAE